ncbi:predicted protein [Naegleria gruberi]|uniref:Predicted protein n=1 Tax=Naegleria gruberi TaxID=5762 RepID=D2V1W9_NAEGR|nr:uncharacterized protein NAEGRDRAFT_62722 [Naegleria gruberi]EFC49382.1 predicted protein [Naegleria gruberi]|eukprot:XP_002682126.1 predicted protein [Naegleria gruberi strain NEG-M]
MAKGLGIEIMITHFLRKFCDPSQLVLIINSKPYEEELIKQLLLESGLIKIENLPKSITSTFTINERVELYNQGGCLFITSRILIVDLLNDKVPIKHVSGIVVLNAHEITDKSTESFILRVFRLSNSMDAFVKAFTENAEELTKGFSRMEQLMRLLFIDRVEFKPRFDLEVSQSLMKYQPIVKEIIVPMSQKMRLIENAIIDIITTAINSLKKNNPSVCY